MNRTHKLIIVTLLGIVLCLGLSVISYAQNLEFISYYPTPKGEFSNIHLSPRDLGNIGDPCTLGTIYMDDSDNEPYLCADDGAGAGIWAPLISAVWQFENFNVATINYDSVLLRQVENSLDPGEPIHTVIGVGTDQPEFGITLDTNAGFLFTGDPDMTFTLPPVGEGSHFIWHPKKGALRIGVISDYPDSFPATAPSHRDGIHYWDENNIGKYSTALGHNNLARGNFSSALAGHDVQTYGPFSTAISSGRTGDAADTETTCNPDDHSDANNADGCYSTAFRMTISGYASAGAGDLNGNGTIDGDYSFTGGSATIESDYSGTGAGINNGLCSGSDYSAVLSGASNTINSNLIPAFSRDLVNSTEGCPATPQFNSIYSTIASGRRNKIRAAKSVIFSGEFNVINDEADSSAIISGNNNRIETSADPPTASVILSGINNIITGHHSVIANGYNNAISGNFSTILTGHGGDGSNPTVATIDVLKNSTISGDHSIIITGRNNYVESDDSLVFGKNVHLTEKADRTFAFAFHEDNGTTGDACTFDGTHYNDCLNIDTNDAFIIYADDSNSDGVGDMKLAINNTSPSHPLHINTGTAEGGNGTFIDINGDLWIQGVNTGSSTGSDRRLKKNITAINEPLKRLLSLSPKTFLWKDNTHNDPDGPSLGFIAQEVRPLFPQWVGANKDDFLTLNPRGLEGLITEAVRKIDASLTPHSQSIQGKLDEISILVERAEHNRAFIKEKRAAIQQQEMRIEKLKGEAVKK